MSILLVILLPILGTILYEALSNAYVNIHREEVTFEVVKCEYHDWSHDMEDNLFCIACNYKAGNNI